MNTAPETHLKISGHTKVAGIFGDPVEQTLSPAIHNAAFEALGLEIVYVPFRVEPNGLKEATASIKALNMLGMSITIPHKEKILKFLSTVDLHAKEIGAVNTVVNRDGKLIGYNTDGMGYLLSLREDTGFTPKGKNIIIIGAGGASRSIFYYILSGRPKSVVLANRTVKRAQALAKEFRPKFNVEITAVQLEQELLRPYAQNADLLVNATSLGMMGRGKVEAPLDSLPPHAVVSDIVYRPLKTELLKKAESRGLKTHTGLGMLVHQGAIAFELWTGEKAPVEVMKKAALRALRLQ